MLETQSRRNSVLFSEKGLSVIPNDLSSDLPILSMLAGLKRERGAIENLFPFSVDNFQNVCYKMLFYRLKHENMEFDDQNYDAQASVKSMYERTLQCEI